MARRRYVWLLALPLALAGWLAAHWLAYLVVAPDTAHRHELLSETGHGYLGGMPLLAGSALALIVTGLALALHDGLRGRASARLPVWPFAIVAPLGFAVQEHVERWIESGAFPWAASLEPTFIVGAALQLPLVAIAVLLARAVLLLGHALGRGLLVARPRRTLFVLGPRTIVLRPLEPLLPRPDALATGHGVRGPPASATSS